MSRILIGVLQPGARLLGTGINGARRGVAMFNGQPRGVIVKECPPEELAAECFCALLADALSVNTPPVGIVFEDQTPLFASIDVQTPNLMQQFCIDPDVPNSSELQVLVDELVQWVGLGRLIALDVLVRNADRHPGNLLTDGQDYWAIDHGRTLDLFPYVFHKTYRLISQFSNELVCVNVESSAISNALTFPEGCELPALNEVSRHQLVAAYAQKFAELVAIRRPSLASSVKGLL
jgi:hypothetical protein